MKIDESAVVGRIGKREILAIKMPDSGERRIPTWALNARLVGGAMARLFKVVRGATEYDMYDFLSTPNGGLKGLRPFECLVSRRALTPSAWGYRMELNASLEKLVHQELRDELKERLEASRAPAPVGPIRSGDVGRISDIEAEDAPVAPSAKAMANLLDALSARDRRALAIRFLRSERAMGELLKACKGDTPEAQESRKVLACVVLMIKQDAPEDLAMTDPALYRRLRKRVTELRMSGWQQR